MQLDRAYAAAAELARLIEELDRADSVIVVSFDDSVLTEFRSLIDNVATSPGQTSLVNWYCWLAPLGPRVMWCSGAAPSTKESKF